MFINGKNRLNTYTLEIKQLRQRVSMEEKLNGANVIMFQLTRRPLDVAKHEHTNNQST